MTFHTYAGHQFRSWNSWLMETEKKVDGQMDNDMTRDHDELLFFTLCFSGRVAGVLL